MSLVRAEFLWTWANWTLLASLIVGVISTFTIIASGNVKDAELKRDLAAASANADRAKVDVANANAEIAKSNKEVAKANTETARLKLELEREVQKRAPRRITKEQEDAIISNIKGKIDTVALVIQRDVEAQSYSLQWGILLQKAGCALREIELPAGETLPTPTGVVMHMPGNNDEASLQADPLFKRLTEAGLYGGNTSRPFASVDLKRPHPPMLPDGYLIYVGQKPPW